MHVYIYIYMYIHTCTNTALSAFTHIYSIYQYRSYHQFRTYIMRHFSSKRKIDEHTYK